MQQIKGSEIELKTYLIIYIGILSGRSAFPLSKLLQTVLFVALRIMELLLFWERKFRKGTLASSGRR